MSDTGTERGHHPPDRHAGRVDGTWTPGVFTATSAAGQLTATVRVRATSPTPAPTRATRAARTTLSDGGTTPSRDHHGQRHDFQRDHDEVEADNFTENINENGTFDETQQSQRHQPGAVQAPGDTPGGRRPMPATAISRPPDRTEQEQDTQGRQRRLTVTQTGHAEHALDAGAFTAQLTEQVNVSTTDSAPSNETPAPASTTRHRYLRRSTAAPKRCR